MSSNMHPMLSNLMNGYSMSSSKLSFHPRRSADGKRVVGVWAVHEGISHLVPSEDDLLPIQSPSPPPFEIRSIEGKGRGMFAARDIRRGETIVCERPAIILPKVIFDKDAGKKMESTLLQLVYMLDQETRERYIQLSNCHTSSAIYGPLTGIQRTNALGFAFEEHSIPERCDVVCLDISLCNHSCDPNAFYDSEKETVTFRLRATKDIPKGEEITITYIHRSKPLTERQAELQNTYGFKCACSVCSAPYNAKSEERRKFITASVDGLQQKWAAWMGCPPRQRKAHAKRDSEMLKAILRAMDEENLHDRRAEVTQYGAFLFASQCDLKNFKKWGKETVVAIMNDRPGESHAALARQMEGWLQDPTSLPVWGKIL